jgi:glycerol kinase
MLFDHGGNEVGRHQLEHEQILPRAGWVEQARSRSGNAPAR